jgi:hypothetical protein
MTDTLQEYLRQLEDRAREELAKNESLLQSFTELYLDTTGESEGPEYKYFHTIGITAEAPRITSKLLPKAQLDRDGLYSMSNLQNDLGMVSHKPGSLRSDGFEVLYDAAFRRGYYENNNWAPRFVDVFAQQVKNRALDCYISLDPNRVRINLDNLIYVEADTWYGPKFSESIEDIDNGNVKLSVPLDLQGHGASFLFNDVESLDLSWATKGRVRQFQAMEFKGSSVTSDRSGVAVHPVRYLHSEYDIDEHAFRHIDGALQFMTPDEYSRRKSSDFSHHWKDSKHIKAEYKKIFKVNGALDLGVWMELVSHFFHGNCLVHEYFTGEMPSHIQDAVRRIREMKG